MPKRSVETPLTGKTKSGKVLTEQEELFCNLYVKDYKRIEAIAEAYNIDKEKNGWRNTAKSMAYENLTKPYINERIRELLDKFNLNDESVDSELSFLIYQNADLSNKKGGVDIYNRLNGRYEKDNKQKQTIVTVNVEKQAEINKALEDI